MNVCKNRTLISFYVIGVISFMISLHCYANQVDTIKPTQEKINLILINSNKITTHEKYVIYAQKRYRLVKPLLTASGVTCVIGYFWLTSSSLSGKEIDEIKDFIEKQKKQTALDTSWFDWSKSNANSIGGVAVELIGGALIIPPLSELIDKLTGCVHIMSTLELYDKEYTHCDALITQMARDMQMNIASQIAGKPVAIGATEIANASNRLVHRMEKLIGFMRVEVSRFRTRALRKEAQIIEKRFVQYTNELCTDMQCLIDATVLDYSAALELIVQFAQRYAQEMQRFSFLEQDAREGA